MAGPRVFAAAMLAGLMMAGPVAIDFASAQDVPLPIPAPQPKSAAPRPSTPMQLTPGAQQQRDNRTPAATAPIIRPPSIFNFGGGGQTVAFDARQRTLV